MSQCNVDGDGVGGKAKDVTGDNISRRLAEIAVRVLFLPSVKIFPAQSVMQNYFGPSSRAPNPSVTSTTLLGLGFQMITIASELHKLLMQ